MQGDEDRDNQRACKQRSYTSVSVYSATDLGEQSSAAHEGEDIKETVAGEQTIVENVLGTTLMGERIFCSKLRGDNG